MGCVKVLGGNGMGDIFENKKSSEKPKLEYEGDKEEMNDTGELGKGYVMQGFYYSSYQGF